MNAPTLTEIEQADHGQLRAWFNDATCRLGNAETKAIALRLAVFMSGKPPVSKLVVKPVLSVKCSVTSTQSNESKKDTARDENTAEAGSNYFKSLL